MRCFGFSDAGIEHVQFQQDQESDSAIGPLCVRAIQRIGVESQKWCVGLRALGVFGPRIVKEIEEMNGTILSGGREPDIGPLDRVFNHSYIGEFETLDAGVSAYLALRINGRVALWPSDHAQLPADCLEWLDQQPSVPADALDDLDAVLLRFFDTDCFGLVFKSSVDRLAAPELAAGIAHEFDWVSLSNDYLY